MLTEINKLLGKLATTNRYSDTRLINPESVLEHTGYVAMLSMFIVRELREYGEDIDSLMVLKKALVHDIEEALTGDIISPTKHANEDLHNEIMYYSETCAQKVIKSVAGNTWGMLYGVWVEAKSGKEGHIIAIADALSVVCVMEREILQFGNLHLKLHLKKGLIDKLESLKSKSVLKFENAKILINIIDEGIITCQKIFEST